MHMRAKSAIITLAVVLMAISCDSTTAIPNIPGTGDQSVSGMLDRVNTARSAEGLPSLASNALLGAISEDQADYIASIQELTHADAGGGQVSDRADSVGYAWTEIGEIVGFGMDADDVFQMWMDSPGHRANILRAQFTEIGVAKSASGVNTYWCLVFGDT